MGIGPFYLPLKVCTIFIPKPEEARPTAGDSALSLITTPAPGGLGGASGSSRAIGTKDTPSPRSEMASATILELAQEWERKH